MHDLKNFGLSDVVECSAALRRITSDASSMEDAASKIVTYLYDQLLVGEHPALALVRFFKTHSFDALQPQQKKFALNIAKGIEPPPGMKCLTLLATRGDEPDWNSRLKSRGHAAIPLPSEKIVQNAPMISQLITQLGLDIGTLISPVDRNTILDLAQRSYNVFYVPEAKGSPYIVAQNDFVVPYRIRSVLGFGGMLPSGNLFAVIMFSKEHIDRETADMFANVALAAKLAVLPFDGRATFAESAA
ncbi:MAG TPA: hypothetical protein VI391_08080 [Thermoanaerobaculia bacterium]